MWFPNCMLNHDVRYGDNVLTSPLNFPNIYDNSSELYGEFLKL